MATKQLYATGTFKYANRMMRAGDPVEMSAPHARLYTALGKVTEDAPKGARFDDLKTKPTEVKAVKVAVRAPAKPKAKPRKKAAKKTA